MTQASERQGADQYGGPCAEREEAEQETELVWPGPAEASWRRRYFSRVGLIGRQTCGQMPEEQVILRDKGHHRPGQWSGVGGATGYWGLWSGRTEAGPRFGELCVHCQALPKNPVDAAAKGGLAGGVGGAAAPLVPRRVREATGGPPFPLPVLRGTDLPLPATLCRAKGSAILIVAGGHVGAGALLVP